MKSASAHFPGPFKTVNYCLIYDVDLALPIEARCVRINNNLIFVCLCTRFCYTCILFYLLSEMERGQ